MKKFGLILFMVVMCVAYFFYAKARPGIKNETVLNAIQVDKKFNEIKTSIEEKYPSTAKEVIQKYNELIGYAYCSSMKDEYIQSYIEDLNLLYSKELIELNPVDQQVAKFTAQRMEDEKKPLVVIQSEIETVVKAESNGEISDKNAQVEVKHSTNKGDIIRVYSLVKEDGKWKINSWKDQK